MIEIKNLNFAYENSPVLRNIHFKFENPKIYGLFGPNGSGKSTLLKCLAGLLLPQEGDIIFKGHSIKTWKINEFSKEVAYLPQEHRPFFPYLVKEIVLMGRTPYIGNVGFGPKADDVEQAREAMEATGIEHLADKPYTNISGGERQLVMLARGLAQNPSLMLLDEPTLNLDFKNQYTIWELIKGLSRTKDITFIIASHDPNHILWYCDLSLLIHKGEVKAKGIPGQILTKQNLESLYGIRCDLLTIDDKSFLYPLFQD